MYSKQGGNILFLILLAVVLFAALSYAVIGNERGQVKSASSETLKTQASQLLQFGAMLENTVNRARLTSGSPDYGLDFDDGSGPSLMTPNATCGSQSCRIFASSSSPGLMTSLKFGEEFIDPSFRATIPAVSGTQTQVQFIQVLDVGTPVSDVVLVIGGLKAELCQAINLVVGGQAINPYETYGDFTMYSGTLSAMPSTFATFGDLDAFFKGKTAGCIGRTGASPSYGGDFYYVLMAR